MVVALAAALVLAFIAASLLPSLRSFVSKSFLDEVNYVEKGRLHSAPSLEYVSNADGVAEIPIGQELGKDALLADITARSSSGEDLTGQLSEDFDKSPADRKHVFVYKINADGSHSLVSNIDTSRSGEWAVFYLLKDGRESAFIKVTYIVG